MKRKIKIVYSFFPLQIKIFFQEHIETAIQMKKLDVDGSGYFDLLDKKDKKDKKDRMLWIEFN